jgi:hypothetical protein
MKTVVGISTRSGGQLSFTIDHSAASNETKITKDEYLAAILAGYPGAGVKIEPAYSQTPPGVIGSRANGMFLN